MCRGGSRTARTRIAPTRTGSCRRSSR
jgi:hypothetical protein